MNHLLIALVVAMGLAPLGCEEAPVASAPERPTAQREGAEDGVVSVVMPPDLIVHRYTGAVQGVSGDGAYRIHVERLPPEELLRLAARAKDAWSARGWEVTGEQHFEKALFAAMRRGGGTRSPAERREVWWIKGDQAVTLCDVIARKSAFDRLGDPTRVGCQTIEVIPWPARD